MHYFFQCVLYAHSTNSASLHRPNNLSNVPIISLYIIEFSPHSRSDVSIHFAYKFLHELPQTLPFCIITLR